MTIKHEVQKKLCAALWQYVEEIITPMNDEDLKGANKWLWGLFKHSKSDSKRVPPLKHHGNLITNTACKTTIIFKQLFPISVHKPCTLRFDATLSKSVW